MQVTRFRYRLMLAAIVALAITAAIGWTRSPGDWAAADSPAPVDRRLDRIAEAVDFDQAPLPAVLDWFHRTDEINFNPHWPEGLPFAFDAPVSLHLRHVSYRHAFDALLVALNAEGNSVGWTEDNGLITIDLQKDLDEASAVTRLYDIRPILRNAFRHTIPPTETATQWTFGPPPSKDAYQASFYQQHGDDLRALLAQHIEPASWRDNGGSLGLESQWLGFLLIHQTPRAHAKIAALLRSLPHDD